MTVFYDHDEAEILRHEDKDEAIEAYLDDCDPILEKMKLVHYRHIKISEGDIGRFADNVHEMMFEWFEEEYGNFEEDRYPMPGLKELSVEFVKNYAEKFKVWRCEPFDSEEIDCRKWVRENAPHWSNKTL